MSANTGAINSWDDLREAAVQAYSDGISILATMEIIERSNRKPLLTKLTDAGAGRAVLMLRNAAFAQIHHLAIRAFSPTRNGHDFHLRAAIDFLRNPGNVEKAEDDECSNQLQKAIELFDAADKDSRLKALRHVRNRELAHWAKFGDVERPRINDLFFFCLDTCEIFELLAAGTSAIMVPLQDQVDAYRDAAEIFWSKWEV
ncbi:hypothetical protein SAMN03159422_02403 [Agrobacterium fabrum]|uniref:AbiU2 domain-containing protein n=1 Tax=Agrobacterium fabrum TaxID=1176649 RepID=UPI00088112F2|nr:hypothetical protein [Agrobacterium fabrum]MDH6295334.1 hypothetical protein [Agrobacterium fabrum]SDB60886.1 hypothetical protein SAMN03159422_02403 [Agrobacterium fabrum]SER31001.1 hypothetical protein SAMN03159504_02647 [Agrobacterium fabrum]